MGKQSVRQAGRQAGGQEGSGLTGSTWGSLKCINKLNRERGNEGSVGGELGSWWTGTASLDLLTFRSFQTAPNANCNLISNPASGARSSMAIICCKYSLTLTNTHTHTLVHTVNRALCLHRHHHSYVTLARATFQFWNKIRCDARQTRPNDKLNRIDVCINIQLPLSPSPLLIPRIILFSLSLLLVYKFFNFPRCC